MYSPMADIQRDGPQEGSLAAYTARLLRQSRELTSSFHESPRVSSKTQILWGTAADWLHLRLAMKEMEPERGTEFRLSE